VDLVELGPLLVVLGKPKVSNFVGLVLDEDVGGFQIPVDDRMLVEIPVAPHELLEDDEALRLGQFLTLLQDILEGAFVAELLEEIDVIGRLLDVIEFDDVVVFDGLHDLYLVFKGVVEFLCVLLDVAGGDGFDCDQIAIADVRSLVDLSI